MEREYNLGGRYSEITPRGNEIHYVLWYVVGTIGVPTTPMVVGTPMYQLFESWYIGVAYLCLEILAPQDVS